jgi:hypothetical protein
MELATENARSAIECWCDEVLRTVNFVNDGELEGVVDGTDDDYLNSWLTLWPTLDAKWEVKINFHSEPLHWVVDFSLRGQPFGSSIVFGKERSKLTYQNNPELKRKNVCQTLPNAIFDCYERASLLCCVVEKWADECLEFMATFDASKHDDVDLPEGVDKLVLELPDATVTLLFVLPVGSLANWSLEYQGKGKNTKQWRVQVQPRGQEGYWTVVGKDWGRLFDKQMIVDLLA